MPEEAFVGLGSNLGDRRGFVASGVAAIRRLPGVELCVPSSLYETDPVGLEDQPGFINAVALVRTSLSPSRLLRSLLAIEQDHGRQRLIPDGPRTLDLDLLLHGSRVAADTDLQVPHPRMTGRCFVLRPLLELAPGLVHPGTGERLSDCLDRCDCSGVRPAGRLPDRSAGGSGTSGAKTLPGACSRNSA